MRHLNSRSGSEEEKETLLCDTNVQYYQKHKDGSLQDGSLQDDGLQDDGLQADGEPMEQLKKEGSKRTIHSFLVMSLCFAMNHGAITTVVSFAGADFKEIGTFSNGILYGGYCVSALLFANLIVSSFGLKKSLVAGVAQYCIYLSMYLLAMVIGPDQLVSECLVLVGAAVGGVAAGYLWVAQGGYFSLCAKRYARFTGKSLEETNTYFSSRFAICYLLCEVFFHFAAAVIKMFGAGDGKNKIAHPHQNKRVHLYDEIMYAVLFIIGVTSAVGMLTIENVEMQSESQNAGQEGPDQTQQEKPAQTSNWTMVSQPAC
jgi:hypothetical protein